MRHMLATPIIFFLIAFSGNDELLGDWESKPSPKGNVTRIVFKPDNSFDGFINKKPFVTGQYQVENNILSFVDNGCNGARGVYKLIFFSNSDSLRFEPIQDSCEQRKNGMSRTVVGRVK